MIVKGLVSMNQVTLPKHRVDKFKLFLLRCKALNNWPFGQGSSNAIPCIVKSWKDASAGTLLMFRSVRMRPGPLELS